MARWKGEREIAAKERNEEEGEESKKREKKDERLVGKSEREERKKSFPRVEKVEREWKVVGQRRLKVEISRAIVRFRAKE